MWSFYLPADSLRVGGVPFPDFLSVFRLPPQACVLCDNSVRTAAAIFEESTLYRVAVRARFESLARYCLGL
jgi:hypothetical protein